MKVDTFEVELPTGERYSIARHCPHRGGLLHLGQLNSGRGTITCPLHHATFDLNTGRQLSGPPCASLQTRPWPLPKTALWDQKSTSVRVKLCEFESLDAAWSAVELGAHGLGFHLFKGQAVAFRVRVFKDVLRYLPTHVDRVLLTDLELDDLTDVLKELPFDTIQLYPDWTPGEVECLRSLRPMRILKVMSALPHENFADDATFLARYATCTDGILLDSARKGGTGRPADWAHCAEVVRKSPLPVFLAGGLTANNVGAAVAAVRPFGVDVETGVSDRPPGGPLVKNSFKMAAFLEASRTATIGMRMDHAFPANP